MVNLSSLARALRCGRWTMPLLAPSTIPVADLSMHNWIMVTAMITLSFAGAAVAQEPLSLTRLSGEIRIDGNMSDAAWKTVPPLELTVQTPRFGAQPTEPTVIRVAYDDEAIYLGAWMYDSEPKAIKVHSVARDAISGGDFLNLVIDSFNDNQNAVVFSTTPSGNRIDVQVRNDAEGDNAASTSWNAFWDVEVSRDERGWYAEMRVPFSSLRFQETEGRVVMGLGVNRLIGRKNERHIFPAVPPNWSLAPFKPSQTRDVSFEGIRSARPVVVTPYATTRHATNVVLAEDAPQYERHGRLEADVGADIKYALMSNLNLDLTINTDFAEVEIDDARVNLTRFSLFFPERRQFFLEREGIFDYGVSGPDRPFYSRRIGLTPDGEPVAIIGGGRITGRIANVDIGVLDMHIAGTSGQPGENAGVMRVRRNIGRSDSYVGLLGTSRIGGGEHNVVLGGDLELNLRNNDYFTAEISQSFDSRPGSSRGTLPRGRARAQLERRQRRGIGFGLGAGVTGSAYRPSLGFVQRVGIREAFADFAYGILPTRSGLRQVRPWISGAIVGTNGTRNIETWRGTSGIELEFDSGATLTTDLTYMFEDLLAAFPLDGGVEIPVGSYRFGQAGMTLAPAQGWSHGAGFAAMLGGFYDGRIASLELSPFWNISPYARVTALYRIDRIAFESRSQDLTAHVLTFRPELSLNSRLSSVTVIQYSSTPDAATLNLRLRYNFREGHDLWVVYGHVANMETGSVTSAPRGTTATALTVKYIYAFLL